jgi:alpha-glucosidase
MHAAALGEAPLRPTFVDFPDDVRCFEDCDELMFGPSLLAAPVVEPGQRTRPLYLPRGPSDWFNFCSGERLAPGVETGIAAPLDRLPLVAPAGAIVVMTDAGDDYARKTEEPSRSLRIFPGLGSGESQFTLVEDDGRSAQGVFTRVRITLAWNPANVRLRVEADGDFDLPYRHIRVVAAKADGRSLRLESAKDAPALTL